MEFDGIWRILRIFNIFKGYLRNFWNFKECKGILRNCHERMPPYCVAIECYLKKCTKYLGTLIS